MDDIVVHVGSFYAECQSADFLIAKGTKRVNTVCSDCKKMARSTLDSNSGWKCLSLWNSFLQISFSLHKMTYLMCGKVFIISLMAYHDVYVQACYSFTRINFLIDNFPNAITTFFSRWPYNVQPLPLPHHHTKYTSCRRYHFSLSTSLIAAL